MEADNVVAAQNRMAIANNALPVLIGRAGSVVEFTRAEFEEIASRYGGPLQMTIRMELVGDSDTIRLTSVRKRPARATLRDAPQSQQWHSVNRRLDVTTRKYLAPGQMRNAYAKVGHAGRRRDELNSVIVELQQEPGLVARIERAPGSGATLVRVVALPQLPDTLSLVFAEMAQALRAALDYAINEVALLDGASGRRASFPIFTDRGEYARCAPSMLRGVSKHHRDLVEPPPAVPRRDC